MIDLDRRTTSDLWADFQFLALVANDVQAGHGPFTAWRILENIDKAQAAIGAEVTKRLTKEYDLTEGT